MPKGIVSKKKQKKRQMYQDYLTLMKRGGKSVHKRAKTLYEWEKMSPRTRSIHMKTAASN